MNNEFEKGMEGSERGLTYNTTLIFAWTDRKVNFIVFIEQYLTSVGSEKNLVDYLLSEFHSGLHEKRQRSSKQPRHVNTKTITVFWGRNIKFIQKQKLKYRNLKYAFKSAKILATKLITDMAKNSQIVAR